FLHCEHGVGRGPLMACAVLVAQGCSAPEALRLVRAARWQALPNDRQLAALLNFEKTWRENRTQVG
ncbi:MAG: phosphatase, partial [Chloroflexi bacterium]|nr:phosphatase [Chloroflexota bacterium]